MMNKACLASGKFPDLWKAQANETTKSLRVGVTKMKNQGVRKLNERDDDTVPATVPISHRAAV